MADRYQRNAADPEQVKRAGRREKETEEQFLEYLRTVLDTVAGRAVLWRLLYEARVSLAHAWEENPELTASVWDNSSRIHYHSGRQDFGHLIQGFIRRAQPEALVTMLQEAHREDQRRRDVHAPATATRNP
jgi:hypothetical protein